MGKKSHVLILIKGNRPLHVTDAARKIIKPITQFISTIL